MVGHKKIFSLFIIFNTIGLLYGAPKGLNITMSDIGEEMERLLPLALDKDKFNEEKRKNAISKSLEKLLESFKKSNNHLNNKSIPYKITSKLMLQYFIDAKKSFESGHQDYSRKLIKKASSLCVSCHGQDAASVKIFHKVTRDQFNSNFDFAEFNFMTRRWKKALSFYGQFIENFTTKKNKNDLETALKREVFIYTVILQKDQMLLGKLNKYLKRKSFGPLILERIRNWKLAIEQMSKVPIKGKITLEKINAFAQFSLKWNDKKYNTFYGQKDELKFLKLKRILDNYIKTHPKKNEWPRILLLLSRCESALNFNLFYSISEQYLKECMTKYSKNPYAKVCYQEFENNIIFSFTGSSGDNIPAEILDELKKFKKSIF